MASPDILDFARLLAPIAGENPAGVDLRTDRSPTSPYYAIKDARVAARTAERQLAMYDKESGEPQPAPPDWRLVESNAVAALAEQTKDIEVAAWLIEALVRNHGFAGLRDGFRLARELVEQVWEQLYPLPDEEGLVGRLAPLAGLNGEEAEGALIAPIANVPITEPKGAGPFTAAQYQQAADVDRIEDPEKRARRIEQGAVSMQMFDQAVAGTSAEFFQTLLDDINQSIDEFGKLAEVLEGRCGSSAPPTSQIRNALHNCRDVVQSIAKEKLGVGPTEATAGAAAESAAGGAAVVAAGAIRTRDDAYRTLLQVAEFFRRNEPHNPVSYALEQAVRWGRMSLPDLLGELVPDAVAREQLFKWVGIKPPQAS